MTYFRFPSFSDTIENLVIKYECVVGNPYKMTL